MIKPQKITCDVCNIERRDCNHWFTVTASRPVRFGYVPGSYGSQIDSQQLEQLIISEFRPLPNPEPREQHVCGEICLVKLVTRWTAELSNPSRHVCGTLPKDCCPSCESEEPDRRNRIPGDPLDFSATDYWCEHPWHNLAKKVAQ